MITSRDEIRLLHLIRDPIDTADSMVKAFQRQSFEDALREALVLTKAAADLGNRALALGSDRYRRISYEELCAHPRRVLQHVCQWLGLDESIAWLNAVEPSFDRQVIRTRNPQSIDMCGRMVHGLGVSDIFPDYA